MGQRKLERRRSRQKLDLCKVDYDEIYTLFHKLIMVYACDLFQTNIFFIFRPCHHHEAKEEDQTHSAHN